MAGHKGPFCGGERRGGKGPCGRDAGAGTDHVGTGRCSWHGGASPSGTKAAVEQDLKAKAARELARLNVPPVADPLSELAKLAGQAVAWKDRMAERVNALVEDEEAIRYTDRKGAEQLRSEIALWERALDRCVGTLTAMAKLNIEDRLAGVRQKTADMLERALDQALTVSGLDLERQEAAREEFHRNLRVVA